MSRKMIVPILIALLPSLASCQHLLWRLEGDSGVPEPPPPPPPVSGYFYVDPAGGSDDADGDSVSDPWKTIAYAMAHADNGSVVYLLDGDYGDLTIDGPVSSRTSWNDTLTVTPYADAAAFDRLYVTNMPDAYVRFQGLTIHVPDGSGGPYAFMVDDSSHIMIDDCTIDGDFTEDVAANLTQHGLDINGDTSTTSYIIVTDCNIVEARYPVYVRGAVRDGVSITGCTIHVASASFVSVNTDGGHGTITLEGNVLFGRTEISNDHGSGFSCRSNKLTIRNNVITGFGGSGGIRFYTDVPTIYSDMTIENNLIFGVPVSTYLYCRQMGSDVVIRNNTCVPTWKSEPASDSLYRYLGGSSFALATGGPYSDIVMRGNVLLGINTFVGTFQSVVDEDYNLYWTLKDDSSFYGSGWGAHSTVAIDPNGYNAPFDASYFETPGTFFTGMADFDDTFFAIDANPGYEVSYLDAFTPASGSLAVGGGDADNAPADDLTGIARDSSPDLGALEYVP